MWIYCIYGLNLTISPLSNGHYEYHIRSSQDVLHDPRSETLSFGCFQMTHTCNVCDSTFTQRSDVSRHHRNQHGGEKFACSSCDKSFSRCDNLQHHQKSCSGQVYQCPRCHRKMSSMKKLTSHIGLCSVPTCGSCGEQFAYLEQLQEHKCTAHRPAAKRQIPNEDQPDHPQKAKKTVRESCRCGACLSAYPTRAQLIHHRIDGHGNANLWRVANFQEPYPWLKGDGEEDVAMRNELRENSDFIFMSHRIRTVSSDYNFPCLLPVDDHVPLGQNAAPLLEMIAEVNAEESFKLNLTFGFLLQHKETGNYRFFAPHYSNFYFKTPHTISKLSDWQGVFSELDEEHLKSHIILQRPDTKGRAVMITTIHITLPFGFSNGFKMFSCLCEKLACHHFPGAQSIHRRSLWGHRLCTESIGQPSWRGHWPGS